MREYGEWENIDTNKKCENMMREFNVFLTQN